MSNVCIVVLIGIPGAGKTHFYKYIVDNLHLENTKISYISYDDEKKILEKTEYKNFRKIVYEKANKLLEEITENKTKDNEVIVIDDNMYYRSMRRSFYNLAKKFNSGFCQIFIKCSVAVALERNLKRTTDRVLSETIEEMYTKLEPPSKDNSWEKYFCVIESYGEYSEEDIQTFTELFQEAMKFPVKVEEIPENISQQTHNLFHDVDLMLRKLVRRKIKDVIVANEPQFVIKALSDELLSKKKSVMDNLKNKELFLREFDDEIELENILLELLEKEEGIPHKRAKYFNGNGTSNVSSSTETD